MAQPTDLSRSFGTPHPQPRFWLARLLAERGVQLALVAWVVANALALVLARGTLPFDRPTLAGQTVTAQLMFANVALLEVFCLMGVVYGLTRKRVAPNLAARAPARAIARRETLLLLTYGALGQLGGFVLGRALGWHAISFHLAGTLYGTHDLARPAEVFVWVGYNFIVYAVAPFFFFRRRYSAEALNLTSLNRRNDTVVIVVVLVLEALVELVASSAAILQLRPHQLLLGAPLTFMVYFAGTVLPTMIFVYAILIPRYRKLSGSAAATVLLGGLTYALLHCFDAWMVFASPGDTALSMIFLLFTYFGPGMFKTVLTLRTGNAWVHVWAYHAFVPHVLGDTPLLVKIFHIR
jgi:xanthosine utilization system XapX-like protein